jgi:peptidoglycan/LPS O-acetylase OafA/YrhL
VKLPFDVAAAPPTRNHGLDTLRALAITLVFAYHYMVFVSREPTFGWVSVVGWVGVDLFFVLSGYLIANQLFEGMVRGQQVSLKRFYARRALRTLPVFWVVLAAYFLWPSAMGGKMPPPLWRFLSFTQNYQLQPGTAFSHAWSLCIEEQFYVVFPLVLVVGARLRSSVSKGWALLIALVALGIAARTGLWLHYGRESTGQISGYHPNIYYATLCRFDEILPGVAVAMLKNFHSDAWARWMQRGQALFAWGLVAVLAALFCVYNFYEIAGYGYGFFMTAFGYSLVAAAFAVLVAAALSPSSWLHRVRVPGAYQLALWSYSIYLSHKAIAFVLQTQGKASGWSSATTLIAITVACMVGGAVLYYVVEQPFMKLRHRWFASSFNQPALRMSQPRG